MDRSTKLGATTMAVVIKRVVYDRQKPEPDATQFDLRSVSIGGIEILARPIEFEEIAGQFGVATKYITSCPHCSALVSFDHTPDNPMIAACLECGAGKDDVVLLPTPATAVVIPEMNHKPLLPDPFRNPFPVDSVDLASILDD